MEALFLQIVNMSISAGIVALCVMLLRFIFRKTPRWIICLLWAMVAFRLMIPFSIESEYSLMSSRQVLPDDFIYAASPVINSGIESVDASVNEILQGSLYTPPMNSVNRTQILSFVCSCVWLMGMSGMLLYALISSLILKVRMSDATVLRGNIKQSERAATPFVMGIFRPTVYLPYSIDESDREMVILHEQAHIRRRDHLWKMLAFVLLAVYWFHPLMWISYILFCRDMEKACDEKVISSMNEDERRAYASALLNCAAGRRIAAVSPLAFGETGVKGRILGVMKYKKPALWLLIVVLIVSAAAAVFLLTDPPQQVSMHRLDDAGKTEEGISVPTLRNAADDAAGDGEMLVIYCPAKPKEGEGTIQIGGAVCNEVSDYLRTRNWSALSGELHKASPGSIDFVISNSRRVVIYDSRVASIQYGEEVQWYRTGWGDYNAALALLHAPPHAVIDEADMAEAGSWLKATVVSEARTTYLELGEYIGGDIAEESILKVQASEKGSILFYPDWKIDRLVVNEYYHRRSGNDVQTEKKTFYLSEQNESGAYVLDFSCRGSNRDDIEYFVQGQNGNYVFRITFEGGAAVLSAVAVFKYDDWDIEAELSADDMRTAMKILSNKPMYKDSPSCGFTENVSVRIDGEIYCIANDACPIVYVSGREMYINLSKEENETLRSLLEGYGFTFPCL